MRFKVTGRGNFPLDMLRYDECYPVFESDIPLMRGNATTPTRTVALWTNKKVGPTEARWESFGWSVRDE